MKRRRLLLTCKKIFCCGGNGTRGGGHTRVMTEEGGCRAEENATARMRRGCTNQSEESCLATRESRRRDSQNDLG